QILSDFYIIECEDSVMIKDKVIKLVAQRIPLRFNLDPLDDVQVLTPTRRGDLGTNALNIYLQQALNPQTDTIKKYGYDYGVGDKIIQIVNNYEKEVFNGDIGRITFINKEENSLEITFDNRIVEYEFTELDEISLAY